MTETQGVVAQIMVIVVLLAMAAVGAVIAWSRSSIKRAIDEHVRHKAANAALTWVNDVVWTLVAEAQQTIIERAKADMKSGAIDSAAYHDTLIAVREQVVKRAVELTASRLQTALAISPDQAEGLLAAKVEQGVIALKAQAPMVPRASDPLAPSPQG